MIQTYQPIDEASKLLANQLISDKANYFTSKDYQRFRSGYCEIPKLEVVKPVNQNVTALIDYIVNHTTPLREQLETIVKQLNDFIDDDENLWFRCALSDRADIREWVIKLDILNHGTHNFYTVGELSNSSLFGLVRDLNKPEILTKIDYYRILYK